MTSMPVPVVAVIVALLSQAPQAAPGPAVTVRDGAGRMVAVPAHPQRIVSLAPSVTEMLFALGAGDRVVGVTDFCDYPPEAASRARIGGLINPDLERIVGLKPDLAVATTTGNYLDDAERIERLGIPVYTTSTPDVESMLAALETVGALVGEDVRARALAASLRDRIGRVRAAGVRSRRARTLFVIEPEPLIAPGRGTIIGEALAIAGADLVTAGGSARWGQYDLEQVIGMRPELILTTAANRAWAEGLARRPEWARLPAVAAGQVRVIGDAIQRPGPRMVDGIEEVRAIVAGIAGAKAGAGEKGPEKP